MTETGVCPEWHEWHVCPEWRVPNGTVVKCNILPKFTQATPLTNGTVFPSRRAVC